MWLGPCLLAAACLIPASAMATQPASGAKPSAGVQRVLSLNSADANLPAFVAADESLRRHLGDLPDLRLEFYTESLDLMRFPSADMEQAVFTHMRQKYRDFKVDAVVAVGTPALDFAQRHGDNLWPGVPIVFEIVSTEALSSRKLGPRTTGIPVRYAVKETIQFALGMRPASGKIFIVGGAADFDLQLVEQARVVIAAQAPGREAVYLAGQPLADILDSLRRAPADATIIYLSMVRDSVGPLLTRAVVTQLSEAATAPIFGFFEPAMGYGVSMGIFTSNARQGLRTGELVERVLRRENPAALGVLPPLQPGCVADSRWLARWNIDERQLPEGCEIRFVEPSAWARYRWQISAGLAVIVAEALLIAALLYQRRQRLVAEQAELHRRKELWHAGRLATAGELTATIAHEVIQPLGAILANVGAAEMLMERDTEASTEELRQVLVDLRTDDLRAIEIIQHLRALLARHEPAREPLDMALLVNDVLRLLGAEARRRQVALVARCDEPLPVVHGDRVQLQQVLLNLVMNAMDAMAGTPSPARQVTVRTFESAGGVEVTVADQGPGIAADVLPRLFESFFTTKPQGMGLGLSIARSIAVSHNGRLWAESTAGRGATFHLLLPDGPVLRAAPAAPPAAAAGPESTAPARAPGVERSTG